MGTDLTALRDILGDGENVLRGLNPKHCENGLPTEGCFIIKAHDEEGPSFGILIALPENESAAPLGARQGITAELFATLLPSADYGVSMLNVGTALQEVRGRGVIFIQIDDDHWGEYRHAHAMLSGYQTLERRTLNDLKRFLAKIAAQNVLKRPLQSPSSP